jgi:glutathionyl-hydroquinone reductase
MVRTRRYYSFTNHGTIILLNLDYETLFTEMGKDGSFKRQDSAWRNWISREEGAIFPPEKDRYHLYVAAACPWAHRTMMTRAIKGLQDVISLTVVMPGEFKDYSY